jgi:hypothetical protein
MFKKEPKNSQYFFNEGWGNEQHLKTLSEYTLQENKLRNIEIQISTPAKLDSHFVSQGRFKSPFPSEYLPEEAKEVHFELHSPGENFADFPVCVIFSMTGDQGYTYRYNAYVKALLKKGIGSLLVENPFYGTRRPSYQKDFHFVSVQDMLVMALSSVEEGLAIVNWLRNQGCKKIGVGGVSQAAMIAGGIGALTPFPIAVACSLVAHSPEVILCDGLLRKFVNWKTLHSESYAETQYRLIKLFKGTDLTQLPRPFFPKATLLQGARIDLVAPRYSVKMIHRLWPGSELSWLPGTHITSLLYHKRSFPKLVAKAFKRLEPSDKDS